MYSTSQPYDVIGIGFGPANISVAGALLETKSKDELNRVLFLERQDDFQWQGGMLLDSAKMQISFMKDLATLRNPQSPLTFLNYLHAHARLVPFINRGSTIPSRIEYADYLSWAAKYVQDAGVRVRYGSQVVGIDEVDGLIEVQFKNTKTEEINVLQARNIIISPGGSARMPPYLAPYISPSHPLQPLVAHSSTYLHSVPGLLATISGRATNSPLRIAVLGSGQSAAEVSMNLLERLKDIAPRGDKPHSVDMIIRKGSLKPSDDSPFANEVFDPETTGQWFSYPSDTHRVMRREEYKSTNYGVVNPHTLENLYEIVYNQKIQQSIAERSGKLSKPTPLLSIHPYSNVVSVTPTEEGPSGQFALTIEDLITNALVTETYDAIIAATGYVRHHWIDMLKASPALCERYGLDKSIPSSDYVVTPGPALEQGRPVSDPPSPHGLQAALSGRDWLEAADELTDSSDSDSSGINTPLTSLNQSTLVSSPEPRLHISREYRLLPVKGDAGPKIFLQGVEERTHGLSDTLLSVVSVRGGEVAKELVN